MNYSKILRNLFTTKMYLVILLDFLLLIIFSKTGEFGLNKTVGWAFDLSNVDFFLKFTISIFLFFTGFGFLALARANTNLILSVLHFALISFCVMFGKGYHNIMLIDNILIISIILFIIIFCESIYLKIKNKQI